MQKRNRWNDRGILHEITRKGKKIPFPQRMWISEGYTEEEIEKMLDDIKKQEMHKEKG